MKIAFDGLEKSVLAGLESTSRRSRTLLSEFEPGQFQKWPKQQTVRDSLYGVYSGGTKPGIRCLIKGGLEANKI